MQHSLSIEMGRTAAEFGGPIQHFQYSHDIRGHRFRMQFQVGCCCSVVFFWGKTEDHGTIVFLCQTEESATLYKHCNRIWP